MKLRKLHFNPYGLQARLGLSLAIAAIICTVVFFLMNASLNYVFSNYYTNSNFEHMHIQKQHENLQEFIDKNNISSQNLDRLKAWEKKQPLVLLEIYADNTRLYSSVYDVPVSSLVLTENMVSDNSFTIQLADQQASAFIYSDFTYKFNVISNTTSIIAALVLFILLFLYSTQKLIRYICRLNEEVQILEGGNLEYHVSEEGNDEITDLAKNMNRMKTTLLHQMETEQQLYQANRQLITEMSHDLRTPLTGIMLYMEILRSHRFGSEEELQDYLEKIDAKVHHLKLLTDHLFEYSMHETIEKQTEPLSIEQAFKQAVSSIQDDLHARGFSVESDIHWESSFVQVNPEYVHRIFENITSNIIKYAEKSADIRIETLYSDKYCGFSVMNTSSVNYSPVESNGVGIDSITSMMKQMNGICNVEQTDTTFEITLMFPLQ